MERLEQFLTFVQITPLAVSLAAGAVAAFAAFAGLSDLMTAAGTVSGASAALFLVLTAE